MRRPKKPPQPWSCSNFFGRLSGLERSWAAGQKPSAGLVLTLGVMLKLPPRVGLPLFDFWVLSNLLYVLRETRHPARRLATVLVALTAAAVPYAYKTLHRRTVLQAERRRNELRQQQLTAAWPAGTLLVTDVLPATYKSASPFRNPDLQPAKVLLLAGWTTADPSQAAWRQQLTGTRDFAAGMRQLAQPGSRVRWLLTPRCAEILNKYLKHPGPEPSVLIRLMPDFELLTGLTDSIAFYQPRKVIVQ